MSAPVDVLAVMDDEPLAMDFEQYAALRGASMADVGDAGVHKRSRRQSDKQWKRILATVEARSNEILSRRTKLREEYEAALSKGLIRQPTRDERLAARADGHPDLESTQAARRILAKRAALAHVGGAA